MTFGDGFPYGDWTAPYRIPTGRDAMLAAYGESFDLLLGRRTYPLGQLHADIDAARTRARG